DVTQVDRRAPGGARKERDGPEVLRALEVLAREHHAQVELAVPLREAGRNGSVERRADRLPDAHDIEAEVGRALAVQLDDELRAGLLRRSLDVLEARHALDARDDLVGDPLQLVEVVALDVDGDVRAGHRGAQPWDARR